MNKKIAVLAAGGLGALITFGILFAVLTGGETPDQQLKIALSVLDQDRWDVTGRLAQDLAEQVDQDQDATWNYIKGVSLLKSVEDHFGTPYSRRTLLEATENLEKANELGFPPGYQGKGNFYLGWCYFHTYRWDEAIEQLKKCPLLWPAKRSDAYRMIVTAQLRKSPPDVPGATEVVANWNAIPGVSAGETANIRIAQAQIAFAQGDTSKCEELLNQVDKGLAEYFDAQVWRGRWRLETVASGNVASHLIEPLLTEARSIFRDVRVDARTPADLRQQTAYLSGKVQRAQDNPLPALSTFNGIRQSDPLSAEGIAAGLEEAEILLARNDIEGAVTATTAILQNIDDLSLFDEQWISAPELKKRLLDMGRVLRDRGQYLPAIQMADSIALAYPLADSVRLKAEVYEGWGQELSNSRRGGSGELSKAERLLANEKFKTSAELYERLAVLELRSSEYTDILWSAITNYQRANELSKANELLSEYIRFEDRSKRVQGFLALGKNRMSAGNWMSAIEPLQRCLEDPDHPLSYEARLLAAQVKSELNQLEEAKELLIDNLHGHKLRPENEIWKDSKLELGQLLYRQATELAQEDQLDTTADWETQKARLEKSQALFSEAADQLGEWAGRWPASKDPRHFDARYMFAQAHRLSAETPKRLIEANPNLIESARRKLLLERRSLLEIAAAEFGSLHEAITQQIDTASPPDRLVSLLRNSYFGQADALFDLGQWEPAIEAYKNVTSRFSNQPESLEAMMQIAQCLKKLGRPADARRQLNMAKQVLSRIPAESDTRFISVTRGSRADWERSLDLMLQWD